MDAVQPGKGLHGIDPAKTFFQVHGMKQGLVKAGLELIGNCKEAVSILFKGRRSLIIGEVVYSRSGVGPASLLDLTRKSNQSLVRQGLVVQVTVKDRMTS